jgi:hypothetical protein
MDNLEPLNIFEFLLTVLLVSKAADRCVSSGWPSVLVQLSLPAGVNNLFELTHGPAAFETKRTVSNEFRNVQWF